MFVGRLKSEVPQSIEALMTAIVDKDIQELNISDNALGPIGVQSLEASLKAIRSLKGLLIANNGLGPVSSFNKTRYRKEQRICVRRYWLVQAFWKE